MSIERDVAILRVAAAQNQMSDDRLRAACKVIAKGSGPDDRSDDPPAPTPPQTPSSAPAPAPRSWTDGIKTPADLQDKLNSGNF